MRTVKDACVLRPKALSTVVSDQIEQLEELVASEGDGVAFFERTYITGGLQSLINGGMTRLAGQSGQAVFHLKQAMGGGKTHSLVAMGLLARNPSLRARYCPATNGNTDLADMAVVNGRNEPDRYFWGDIATQLGKEGQFKSFWANGPKAPGESDWLKLFEDDRPTLILLDEMPAYFSSMNAQASGKGTLADIAVRAFSNMLSAAGKKRRVCVVLTDLAAAYDTGGRLINQALEDAKNEVGRQAKSITPVDLSASEIYDILRKTLFEQLPPKEEIQEVARAYEQSLLEAVRSKLATRGAGSLIGEVEATYPFHPRLKNIIALFKENEKFMQTRGLIEMISLLLRSVWKRPTNDVYLIGAQDFDLSIAAVRDKLRDISGMGDVVARDLWDDKCSAHAQLVDQEKGADTGTRVGTLLFLSSLSTSVTAVKGLSRSEMVECLVSPFDAAGDFVDAFERLEKSAWYLHHTPEGRYYFDRQENLTKLLEGMANEAPENKVNELIRHSLEKMFEPRNRAAYTSVMALPRLEEAGARLKQERVLLIISPDSKMPPEEVRRLFEGLTQKNNLCVLTGDRSAMGSVETAARQLYATMYAKSSRIPEGHVQRKDLEAKHATYEMEFNTTVLSLFDKVLFPIRRGNREPELRAKPLSRDRDTTKAFNGEEQIQRTLIGDPVKLYLDTSADFDAIRSKAQEFLWPQGQDEARWSDIQEAASAEPGMYWLPPKGLDAIKTIACNREIWEDLGNGRITRSPQKKKTSVQVVQIRDPDDSGNVCLKVTPQNAGSRPRVYYSEEGTASEKSPVLKSDELNTRALRISFLVVDPSGQFETGEAFEWKNKLIVRSDLRDTPEGRALELTCAPVTPHGTIRYSLDGSEARSGTLYTKPILLGDKELTVRAIAEDGGLEARHERTIPSAGQKGLVLDDAMAATYQTRKGKHLIPSGAATFEALRSAAATGRFKKVQIQVGQGDDVIAFNIGDVEVDAGFIDSLVMQALGVLGDKAPTSVSFGVARFESGHDLKEFAAKAGLELKSSEVSQ